MVKSIKLLEEIERLKFDYWKLKLKVEVQFKVFKKERDLYKGIKSKTSNIENRIVEKIKVYNEE